MHNFVLKVNISGRYTFLTKSDYTMDRWTIAIKWQVASYPSQLQEGGVVTTASVCVKHVCEVCVCVLSVCEVCV